MNKRVVISGLGVISSIGIGWQEFWDNLTKGESGISHIERFDTTNYDRHFGGEIKNFNHQEKTYGPLKGTRKLLTIY